MSGATAKVRVRYVGSSIKMGSNKMNRRTEIRFRHAPPLLGESRSGFKVRFPNICRVHRGIIEGCYRRETRGEVGSKRGSL